MLGGLKPSSSSARKEERLPFFAFLLIMSADAASQPRFWPFKPFQSFGYLIPRLGGLASGCLLPHAAR